MLDESDASFGPVGNRIYFAYEPTFSIAFDKEIFLSSYLHHCSYFINYSQIVDDDYILCLYAMNAMMHDDTFGNDDDFLKPLQDAHSAIERHIHPRMNELFLTLSFEEDFNNSVVNNTMTKFYINLAVAYGKIELCVSTGPFNADGACKVLTGDFIIPTDDGWTIDLRSALKRPDAFKCLTYQQIHDGELESLGITPSPKWMANLY